MLSTVPFEVLTVKASTLTLSDMLLADSQRNTFLPQVEAGDITEPSELKTDVTGTRGRRSNPGCVYGLSLAILKPRNRPTFR